MRQIRSIRHTLPEDAVVTLVISLVLSRLDYCNIAYVGLPLCELRRLQSVMNAAARLVTGARRHDHVMPILRDRHWLPVQQRIDFKLCVLVFQCLHGAAPDYLSDLIRRQSSTSSRPGLRSADTLAVRVPRTRTRLGDRAFAVAAPRVWNALPANVQSAGSLRCFKKLLKTHYFRRAFG